MNNSTLTLYIKRVHFDSIKDGTKKIEYRDNTPHYRSRIIGKRLTHVLLIAGYRADSPRMTVPIARIEYDDETFFIHLRLMKKPRITKKKKQ